jgi:hypothetical protein
MSRRESRSGFVVRLLEVAVVVGALLRRRSRLPRGVDAEDLAAGYEHGDMSPTVVVIAAGCLLAMLGLVLWGVTTLEQSLVGAPLTIGPPPDLTNGLQAAPAPTPPLPRLEAAPGETLDRYRSIQARQLNSYSWVDRSAGIVRIPVDRAIELTAERGLPSRPVSPVTPRDNGATSPSVASSGRAEEAYP